MFCKVFEGNGSLDNRDAHALSPVERILGHFLWEVGPMNVTIRNLNLPVTDLELKN